jgi:hypothetical protein
MVLVAWYMGNFEKWNGSEDIRAAGRPR